MASKRTKQENNKYKPRTKTAKVIPRKQKKLSRTREAEFLLDKFSVEDVEHWERSFKEIYEFQWKEYTHYAHFRAEKFDLLKSSIQEVCSDFAFDYYARSFSLNYHPLSALGSRLSTLGGRFNIGNLDAGKFPSFSALYIAENEDTAVRERFRVKDQNPLAPNDAALQLRGSWGCAKIRGQLETVIDITDSDNLKPFLKQIKKLEPSEELYKLAKENGYNPPTAVKSMSDLKKALIDSDWAAAPTMLDIPSNSQSFGLIAKLAGVQGILYKSRFQTGHCIAVFPENFKDSAAFIEIIEANLITPGRLDKDTFTQFL